MAAPLLMGISAGVQILGGLFGSSAAKKKARNAQKEIDRLNTEMKNFEDSRQEVVNPYESFTGMETQVTNPYQNLQVATQAAEMQAEETDMALASTLDTLVATGAGAAGATALAQAAAKSKQGISSSIEKQEADNTKLRAQGEVQKQGQVMDIMKLQAAGKQFEFQAQETRDVAKLDRMAGQIDQQRAMAAGAAEAGAAATSGMMSGLGSLAGAAIGNYKDLDLG